MKLIYYPKHLGQFYLFFLLFFTRASANSNVIYQLMLKLYFYVIFMSPWEKKVE